VRESTHDRDYSWLPASYPRKEATFPSRKGEISQNNNIKHIFHQLQLTTYTSSIHHRNNSS